jgi:hypothetical protein
MTNHSKGNNQPIKTPLEMVTILSNYRNTLMNEYDRCQLCIDDRLPFLDMVIRLNQEIRTYQELVDQELDRNWSDDLTSAEQWSLLS